MRLSAQLDLVIYSESKKCQIIKPNKFIKITLRAEKYFRMWALLFLTLFVSFSTQTYAGSGRNSKVDYSPPTVCAVTYKKGAVLKFFRSAQGDSSKIFCTANYVEPDVFALAKSCLTNPKTKAEDLMLSCDCNAEGCKHHLEVSKMKLPDVSKNPDGGYALLEAKKKPEGLKPSKTADYKTFLSTDGSSLLPGVECFFSGFGLSANHISTEQEWYQPQGFHINPVLAGKSLGSTAGKISKTDLQTKLDLVRASLENERKRDSYTVDHQAMIPALIKVDKDREKLFNQLCDSKGDSCKREIAPLLFDYYIEFGDKGFTGFASKEDMGAPVFCKKGAEKEWKMIGVMNGTAVESSHDDTESFLYKNQIEPILVRSVSTQITKGQTPLSQAGVSNKSKIDSKSVNLKEK